MTLEKLAITTPREVVREPDHERERTREVTVVTIEREMAQA